MEIIGKTSGGYIVSLTESEAGSMANNNYEIPVENTVGSKQTRAYNTLKVGDKVEVSDVVRKSNELLSAWDESKKAISSFKGAITKFENSTKEMI